ncbi:MAG TPA: phosphatase PAP2 family protein [Phycisphaerae bacterium]|nr:phosphatase PAP2 family protein [Phycisphaerae bacterium]
MKRTLILACLFSIVGCQTQERAPAPEGLSKRLAVVERARLSTFNDQPTMPGSRVRAQGMADARAGRSAAWVREAAASDDASRHDLRALTLGETGETSRFELQTTDEAGSGEVETTATSSEERTTRDPPLASFWETAKRDIKNMPCDLWRDTKRVYGSPVNLVILGTAYAGSLAIQETGPDDTVEHRFNRNNDFRAPDHIMNSSDWRDAFGAIGNPGTHFALAGAWYLLGQQTCNDKTYEVGKTLFSALTINGLTVMVGQAASWDKSPNGEYGTFPSGHTSSSFVVASVMHEAYGHLVGVPLYGLAALAGLERLDDREHYFSDVVMGAVLGTVIGHSVASGRDPEFFGWKLLPYASPEGGAGVAFMKSLD